MTTYGWYSVLKYKQGDIEYLAYNLYGQETLCNLITEVLVVQEDNSFFVVRSYHTRFMKVADHIN